MSKIDQLIPKRNFELVRDRIGEILLDEWNAQNITYNNPTKIKSIWVARTRPFDPSELPAINVSHAGAKYADKHQNNKVGTVQYFIDVYAHAKGTKERAGDELSDALCDSILAICDYILEDSKYYHLGYEPGFIASLGVIEIQKAQADKDDAKNISMGRLIFNVKMGESNKFIEPNMIQGYGTTMKLGNTTKGYIWEGTPY